jgi:hypothetical protein
MKHTLLARNDEGFQTELTTESPLSRYGFPVLRVTNELGVKDYCPADQISGWPNMNAADYVRGVAIDIPTSAEQVEVAESFLSQVAQ